MAENVFMLPGIKPNCQADSAGELFWEGSSGTKTVVLYPGGTPSSPGIISRNQRIIVNNPFPGHYLHVEAQIIRNLGSGSKWSWSGHYNSGGAADFVQANQLFPDDVIVVQSGNTGLSGSADNNGHAFGNTTVVATSAPWRLVVTRLGRIT